MEGASPAFRPSCGRPRRITSVSRRIVSACAMRQYLEASSFPSLADLTSQVDDEVEYLIFAHTLCPYAERVWLAIEEQPAVSDATALVHVDLSRKPSWFREVSPRGLVPTVLHSGAVHIESMDIIEWLLNDSPRPSFMGSSSLSELTSVCLDACGGDAGHWRVGTSISKRQLDALERVCESMLRDDMTLVERIAVYPFLYRTTVVLKAAYGVDTGALCDGRLGVWMRAMLERPSCATTSAEENLFGKAMMDGGLDFFDYSTTSIFEFHPHICR
jgi:hypothetical protein